MSASPTESIQDRIEAGFRRWGEFVVRHRWVVIALSLAVSGTAISWLPEMTADFSNESYLPGDDSAQKVYDAFREQFGRDDHILVGIEQDEVFDFGFLERLRALHRDLERDVPHIAEVTSLINARSTRGEGDELIVEELFEHWPQSRHELAVLRERALGNKAYVGNLISKDHTFTAIVIVLDTYTSTSSLSDAAALEFSEEFVSPVDVDLEYLTTEEQTTFVEALHEVLARHESDDFELIAVGDAVSGYHMQAISSSDFMFFMSLSIVLIVVLLSIMFRRASAAILPLVVVILSILVTFGVMARLGIPYTIPSQVIATLLIAVGICDTVHILAIVYRELATGKDQHGAIAGAIGHSGFPVVMTSLTTAGGLVSFCAAEIAPVANLGIIAPIGVLIALVYTLTLLPASLAVVRLKGKFSRGATTEDDAVAIGSIPIVNAVLARIGNLAIRRPVPILAITCLAVIAAVPGARSIRFSNDTLMWLFKEDPLRVAIEKFDEKFEGINSLEVLIDTGRPNGLHDPENLRRIDAAIAFAESYSSGEVTVGGTNSIVDIVKETHRALNENRPEMYALPTHRELIAQELLLFENSGSEDLEKITDSQFQIARLTLRVNWADGLDYLLFVRDIEREFSRILGNGLKFQVTGNVALNSRSFTLLLSSLARSYGMALIIITPLMMLLIGRVRRGLLSMIPNLIPIYFTLSLMGFTGIPMNISTLLIGCIIIGVAVDDTIHFMHQFGRYLERTGDPATAIRATLATTGSALFVTSVVLAGSFGVCVFGGFYGLVHYGILTFFATVVAFLSDVLIAPALMMVTEKSTAQRHA